MQTGMKQAQTQDTLSSPINTTCINANERFRLQAQFLQISFANSLCVCVCFDRMLSPISLSVFRVCLSLHTTSTHTAWVYIYPALVVWSKDHLFDRRVRKTVRKIIYRTKTHRRIHIYLEGWYILRGPLVYFI
ncbi:hypothetical protein Hanom_Chr14g01306141 [Helianthus anomalus]